MKPYLGTIGAAIQNRDAARTRETAAVALRTSNALALQRAYEADIAAAHHLHQLQQAHAEQSTTHQSTRGASAAALRDASDHARSTQAAREAEAQALCIAVQAVEQAVAARTDCDASL